MGNVSFGGLASGMDTTAIVKAIMESEQAPLKRLQKHQTINNERLKAYSSFNDKLKALETAANDLADENEIQSSKTTLSNEESITVSSSGSTMGGTYDIVVKQLSQMQKSVSMGFDSLSESMGSGTISFDIKNKDGEVTDTHEITLENGKDSLKEIVEAINKQSEESGVTASLINDGRESGNYHILFSGKDAGTSFDIRSELTAVGGKTGADFNGSNTTKTQEAQQAIAYIDGIEIVSNNNILKNTVPGVEITLDKVSKIANDSIDASNPMQRYESTRLSVVPDNDAMKDKVDSFVKSYNGIMEYLQKGTDDTSSLNSYLRTDSSVKSVTREMQNILTSTFGGNSGPMVMLSQAGIETQKDGTLKVDSTKLTDALENNYTDFVNMFAGTEKQDGVMDKFKTLMSKYTDSIDGLYVTKKTSHDSIDKSLDSQILRMESRLEKREQSLNAQFSAMEDMLALFNTQSAFLISSLGM